MQVTSLCSSSRGGNSFAITSGDKTLLVDCGTTNYYLREALYNMGLVPTGLAGCLVTHSHPDHIRSVRFLLRNGVTVAAGPKTKRLLPDEPKRMGEVITIDDDLVVSGHFTVSRVDVPHYAEDGSSCFLISDGTESIAVITDAGVLNQRVLKMARGATYIVCESNHDEAQTRTGEPFPGGQWRPFSVLKEKSLGPKGHLSNEQAASFLTLAATSETKAVMLCHLSEDYNRPEVALATVGKALRMAGWDGTLSTAASDRATGPLAPGSMRLIV
jgi:phosphoribosyl 1,2-cyclic phosphodiesterase